VKMIALLVTTFLGASVALADKDDVIEARKALGAAKLSCSEAIAAAQKEVGDGRVVEVELDWDNNAAHYEVEFLVGETEKEVRVCAVTGKILKIETDVKPDDNEDRRDIARTRRCLDAAKQSFDQVGEIVKKNAPEARVVKTELELVGDKPTYKVKALEGDKIVRIHVDAVDGKISRR
jgi:uncharacterized membrane protein YkoI